MLRSTRLRQRGCTLVASLITIHSRRSIRAILVQRKNIDPLVVTITLNFCMLSLHNLTIFFCMHVRYCTQSCWTCREKEKSFARQYNVMQTSLHGGFNGKPSPPSPDCNPEEDIRSEADPDAADHSYLPPRCLLCLGMMMLVISCICCLAVPTFDIIYVIS